MKLKQYLRDVLSIEELEQLIGSYDVIGDIAITIIPETLEQKESVIGQAILESSRKIKVVTKRIGFYGGEYRTIPLQVIAGEDRKETEVKEFGLRFKLNAETVYYSVRSGSERKRIASLVQDGESVLALFSGVAPYPLIISKYAKAAKIVGVEKNPVAHAYAKHNVAMNKKCQNIDLINEDAMELLSAGSVKYDRIIMPLPTEGERFLPGVIKALHSGGWLHFYDFQQQGQFERSSDKIAAACTTVGRRLITAEVIKCGHSGPRTYRLCTDARIS